MDDRLSVWLRKWYPRDVLMPLEKESKRPAFSHKNENWSWYRYLTKRKNDDVGILLVDICVIDVDCRSVAKALEDRFAVLKKVPCEDTKKGCHYFFSRSEKADVEGYYDGIKQKNSQIDFKTICSNGTSGLVVVTPSLGKSWRKEKAPWTCYPDGRLPEIPDDLLEHIGRASHTPVTCQLRFVVDGETRDIENCNVMAGSAYLDIFIRDPFSHDRREPIHIVPIPDCRATVFDDMYHVCATGELRLTQSEILKSSPAQFRKRIEAICRLADFMGMPTRYDKFFRCPYGYLWSCVRLHDISGCLSAVSLVESSWRFHLGMRPTKADWQHLLIEVTTDLAKKIRYKPIETAFRESLLFYQRPSMSSVFEKGSCTIRSDPTNIESSFPSIIDTILRTAPACVMLAGGSVLGEIAKNCSRGTDYDFFLFGVDAERASNILDGIAGLSKVKEIHRSEYAITFRTGELIFQIITKLFRNPAEILHGFDISACKIGLYIDERNRRNLLATPSWVESMKHRAIWVDDRTWSRSSAIRLCKYYCKGFDVLIPGLVRKALDKSIDMRRRDLNSFEGISLLFAMEFQLHNHKSREDVRTRISLTSLENMVLTKMKRHSDCDYTTFMKTTRFLSSWWSWLSSRNVVERSDVLVWSSPKTGTAICGTFAQSPSNLKDILLL